MENIQCMNCNLYKTRTTEERVWSDSESRLLKNLQYQKQIEQCNRDYLTTSVMRDNKLQGRLAINLTPLIITRSLNKEHDLSL